VRELVYELYGELRHFARGSPSDRERLRNELDWPDVGHVTSMIRALAEEDRFADWARFNGYSTTRGHADVLKRRRA
jgi:hypothetical protein